MKKYPERFSVAGWYWATLGKLLSRFVAGLRGDEAGKLRAKGYWDGLRQVMRGDLTLKQTTMK